MTYGAAYTSVYQHVVTSGERRGWLATCGAWVDFVSARPLPDRAPCEVCAMAVYGRERRETRRAG